MKLTFIEVVGFRSFGSCPQRLEFSSPLAVIHADNSQGKTSLAEAVEFLFTGTTSRRQLGGGSPQEYSNALRNVHVAPDTEVYVEAGIQLPSGVAVLRRTLTRDYDGASDCASRLTYDGQPIDGVAATGIRLAGPPISAPVLLEHALRYAVSAKPGERSEFFRAIIEAADLDEIRTTLDRVLAERERSSQPATVEVLSGLQRWPSIASHLGRERLRDEPSARRAFIEAIRSLAPRGDSSATVTDSMEEAVRDLTDEMRKRQQSLVPLQQLLPLGGERPPVDLAPMLDALTEYSEKVSGVDQASAALIPIFRAVLASEILTHSAHDGALDCPVCQTPGALTPARITAIRRELSDREGLSSAQRQALAKVGTSRREFEALVTWADRSVPRSAGWSDAQHQAVASSVRDLGGDAEALERAADLTSRALVSSRLIADSVAQATGCLNVIEERLSAAQQVDEEIVRTLVTEIEEALAKAASHVAVLSDLATKVNDLESSIEPVIARETSTSGWTELLELAAHVPDLVADLDRLRREESATKRLRATQKTIASATRRVLDQRLRSMAAEIRRWWSLLRPGELTTFGDLTRRGAGNKMLDLTAALFPEPNAQGETRNALAVLSNSQLNALGLSTFLARSQLLNTDLVVLDDPVPGSDPEHRVGFADGVLASLLDSDCQVIIATHDPQLARDIETLHGYRQPDEFRITIVSPSDGSLVEQRGDDFEHLMLEAKGQMGSPLLNNRRAAGNSLRIAAERLAKHIIVSGRLSAGDAEASISDYDGKNLSILGPEAVKYAVMQNEPGYWTQLARLLNSADHDAMPPQPTELKSCYEWLRDIKRKHGVSTR